MSLTRRRFITISTALGLSALAGSATAAPIIWRGIALGAEAKLVFVGLPEAEGRRLIKFAVAELNRLENIFSLYRSESALSTLNRNGYLNMPPAELLSLLSLAKNIHSASGGYFDPTIQPLWDAYAKHRGHPPKSAIVKAKTAVGLQAVKFDADAIRFEKPNMGITLNGIAQGFITDRVVALLRSEGLKNAVVSMGEIGALGRDENSQPWRVGVSENDNQQAGQYICLSDQSIATSAPGGTTFDGVVSHIINPVDGNSVRSVWQRISVIHRSAAIADAYSTAFVLLNEEQLKDVTMTMQKAELQIIAESTAGKMLRFGL